MTELDTDTPRPGRRERKRQQTLDHLADTALRLFEALGYDAVTMEQIAAQADVAKGTLYNYFPVKEALLAYHVHRDLAGHAPGLLEAMRALPGFAARMAYLLQATSHWAESHRAYLPHYLRFRLAYADVGAGAAAPRSGLDRIVEALIETGQQTGEVRADLPPAQLAHLFQYMYLATLTRWLGGQGGTLRREFDATLGVFLGGVAAAPRARRT